MKRFDEELRKALERQEPPEDFTARLFDRIAERERETGVARDGFRRRFTLGPLWQWAMVLLLIVGCVGTIYREHIRVRNGEAAKEQLLLAMRITSQQLRVAQSRLKEVERSEKVMQ